MMMMMIIIIIIIIIIIMMMIGAVGVVRILRGYVAQTITCHAF
jgi:hypothetical protein